MFEYIKTDGKITDILVNGKQVKRGSMRGFKKAQDCSYFRIIDTPTIFINPWSGVEVLLNPLESTIYNFCDQWYKRYSAEKDTQATVRDYDDMKYFLLELNSQAYMDLID